MDIIGCVSLICMTVVCCVYLITQSDRPRNKDIEELKKEIKKLKGE